MSVPRQLTEFETSIVAFCQAHGSLAELCMLVDYDPVAGRVPERWVPKPDVLQLAKHFRTAASMDACEAIQTGCVNGELPDVCEEAIKVIKLD
jgi:hypothetical protein